MGNIQFENRYEVNKQFIRSEYKLSQKRSGKLNLWLTFCMRILFGIVAVFLLFAAFVLDISSFGFTSILFTVITIYLLIYPSIIAPVQKLKSFAQISGERKSVKPIIRTVRFGESIEIQTGNTILFYSYDKVRYVEENEEYIYFWLSSRMVMPLYKNSFSVGSADEFLAFFNEKCSEQKPLWTRRELNKRMLMDGLPFIVILITFFVIALRRVLIDLR